MSNHEHSRSYTQHTYRGKHEVVTWFQKRCVVCKRFLSKRQEKYCGKCAPIQKKRITEEYKKNNPFYWRRYRGIS